MWKHKFSGSKKARVGGTLEKREVGKSWKWRIEAEWRKDEGQAGKLIKFSSMKPESEEASMLSICTVTNRQINAATHSFASSGHLQENQDRRPWGALTDLEPVQVIQCWQQLFQRWTLRINYWSADSVDTECKYFQASMQLNRAKKPNTLDQHCTHFVE